ncbi:MAG: hypothetical protein R2752_22035 [Vicinamibacterales bacterium]
MTPIIDTAREAVTERLAPLRESLEERARDTRRAITRGRHAAEDFAAETALKVRRRPLESIAIAAGVGAIVGALFGVALGWRAHNRRA